MDGGLDSGEGRDSGGSRDSGGGGGSVAAGLVVESLSVRYGDVVALDGVTFSVAGGETMAVIGPSGSGKSSLLRAIAGLEPGATGSIIAGGRVLNGVPTHERDLGLMFQEHVLFPHLSVAENIAFGLEMRGRSHGDRAGRVEELLGLVGLSSFGDRPITALSGGEAQRVALARALAPEPALLMLDEPFGSLDRVLRAQLTTDVGRLLDELGQTAIHVTHDQAEAFAIADRVVVLGDGRIEQVGRPDEVWHRPANHFVASFVGHPNLWVVDVDGGAVLFGSQRLGFLRSGSAEPGSLHEWRTGPVEVVVPLVALVPSTDGPLAVVVERVVFEEGRYRVDARCTGRGDLDIDVVFMSDRRLEPGSSVRLSVDLGQLHPIDP